MAATKMFSKFKGSTVNSNLFESNYARGPTTYNPFETNPISQYFEIGNQTGSAGPELAWKIYDATRKLDKKEASVFFFNKKSVDKLHKPKRKEAISEILKFSAKQLDRYRHPKILTLYHPVEESPETLAFATEPVLGSLANVLGYLEDRLPQNINSPIKQYSFLEFEVKYGLLQIAEALLFLHYSCKIIHRNICPQSVIINKKGTWKLAGFEFTERCGDNDIMMPIGCQPFTSKLPKSAQPDLDFMAPEVQNQSCCSPQSDMFSFGILICTLYNKGRSPLESNLSVVQYNRKIELLSRNAVSILDNLPTDLQLPVQGLLDLEPRRRPTSQQFSMVKYLMDPCIHALQYLDVIQMKDSAHKSTFYFNLKEILPNIPKKMWFTHILPSMEAEFQSSEVLAAALQPLLRMIEESTVEEYQNIIYPIVRNICLMPKSVQATVTLLESMDILISKTAKSDFKQDILPMVYNAFESATPQIQCAALHAVSLVIDDLDQYTISKTVLPRAKFFFEGNSNIQIQANTLNCIERVLDNLEKTEILDEVLPILSKAKLTEPIVLMPVVRIYKRMMSDKRYGLTVNLLATKVLPSLTPVVVSPTLKLEEFSLLVKLLQEMLEHVARNQRNKLKLERLSMPSNDGMQLHRNLDQPIGYPHRPPCLRLETRRTSISVDDVVRRTTSSGASSPDINLLQVQGNLPGRRHSDNTIQPPRILIAPSSPTGSGSMSRRSSFANLHFRRHSSANPNDPKYNQSIFSAYSFKPSQGIDFFIPSLSNANRSPNHQSSSPVGGRRYSTAAVFNQGTNSTPSSLLQTLGSGMQQLFGK
ncbi:SCY1-like protein 2 isoform X2 [Tetranychus urticae]|uniref:SCY1-like protein 2 isoform X2 n=2 Tax=Tetranychus urticae TaxID=32264 RepID=UPI00077C0652|nr:SCY1-like protein 2 isoform X2 [Tetranychus urticae]